MKALPDVKSSDVADNDADAEGVIPSESDSVQVAFDSGRPVIESIGLYSSQSDTEAADIKTEFNHHSHESPEDDDEEENCRRHKSKKKHKKHHHHHHKHDSGGIRKKHKKHKKRVEPIFLWAQNRDSKILRVVCEDYDPHNRLRLVKTGGVWTSNPRSRVQLTVTKSRSSSRYGDDSQKDTDEESTDDGPGFKQPDDEDDRDSKAVTKKQLDDDDEQVQYVDLNDNSIDLVETVCSEEDEDEHQAQIDRALEMIQRDPTLVTTDNELKIPPLTTIETAGLKLPEGTTIHQVKTEHNATTFNDRPVLLASPPLPVPLSPPAMAASLKQQCKFGELTIISQKDLEDQRLQLQNEPLNLETACKRPALEIRLQEPPPVKKRRMDRPPQQQRSQQQHPKQQSLKQQQQQPLPPKSLPIGVKREWDPLSELKEVLSDPRLSVPDPLLVPKARLAALVASPATEIPKLLKQRPPSLLPPPDPDLLTVSLSHLQSILLQHADEQRGNGKAVDGSHLHQSSSNIDQMLWLSYLSTCKDMAGTDADLLSSMLNLLLPPAQNATAAGQPPYGGYHATQQQNQWNDFYYAASNLVVPTYGGGGTTAAGYSKSDDFCASPVLPPLQQKQQTQSSQKHHHQQKTHLPPTAAKQRGVCPEMQCCNGTSSLPSLQPSTCYDMCCSKAGVCNPFVMQLSPAGCGGGGGGGGGNLKAAAVYTASDGVATAAPATCCFPAEMGCSYGCHQPPPPPLPSPVSRKHLIPPQASPGSRNRGSPYGYQTGLGQHHQLLQQQLQTLPSTEYGNVVDGGGDVQKQCGSDVAKSSPPPPPPPPPVAPAAPPSSQSAEGGDDAAAAVAKPPPLQKAKIKVKQHLIDPNAKPKLLNIEGQLHLAGAHDLLSSPLWHPLFGSQEKRYGCRWQWTTPVTTSESTTSSDTSGTH